jgi:diacylglycerol kinase family enzyme
MTSASRSPASPRDRTPSAAILVNPDAGQAKGRSDRLSLRLAQRLANIDIQAKILNLAVGGSDPDGWRRELDGLLQGGLDRVYVLGGDGSILSVASRLLGHEVPLGIIPLGTANLLARDLALPLDPEQAIETLIDPCVRRIDIGRVNGHPFLCASMLGMTTELAKTREALRGLGTWYLLPSMLTKGYWLFMLYPFHRVTLSFPDRQLSVTTRAMVISNNPLQPEPGLYPRRAQLDGGRLGIYGVHQGPLYELPRLALSLIIGTWPSEPRVFNRTSDRVIIDTRKPRMLTALNDGEPCRLRTPLHYDILTAALPVLVPAS